MELSNTPQLKKHQAPPEIISTPAHRGVEVLQDASETKKRMMAEPSPSILGELKHEMFEKEVEKVLNLAEQFLSTKLETPAANNNACEVLRVTPDMADELPQLLRTVADNSTIVFAPGAYVVKEPLIVRAEGTFLMAEVPLAPDGSKGTRLVGALSKPGDHTMLSISSGCATVSNIAFEWDIETDSKEYLACCIAVEGRSCAKLEFLHVLCRSGRAIEVRDKAKPIIQDCIIRNSVIGIHVCGRSQPTVLRNRVDSCVASCVRVTEKSSGKFSGNTFEKGGDACVWAGGSTKGVFRDNLLRNAKGCGVMLGEHSHVTVENCEIAGEHINGIQVGDEADPIVKNNQITGSQGSGIVLYDKGKGLFVGNQVKASKLAGIGIRDKSEPVFVHNTVSEGSGSGFVLLGECGGVYEGNHIVSNTCAGIGMKGTTNGLFQNNIVKDNHGYGVWVQDESCGTFQNNEISSNHSAGFAVSHMANPVVHHNQICGGKHVGILVQNNGRGLFTENTVQANRATNILLVGHSSGNFSQNVICDSTGGGVLFRGHSTCQLSRNRIIGNSRADVAVLDQAKPRLFANVLRDGHGRGLVITEQASGEFEANVIRGHVLAGVYVGGSADPTLTGNIVTSSQASGLVVEDQSKGTFVGNVLLDNESAAVAVQGSSSPHVEANLVRHNGKGGMWLGEKASGIFKNNYVEESHFAWKLGQDITAQFVAPPPIDVGKAIATKIEEALENSDNELLNLKYLAIRNPGDEIVQTVGIKKQTPDFVSRATNVKVQPCDTSMVAESPGLAAQTGGPVLPMSASIDVAAVDIEG
mmetsp:Transcript_10018/g.15673  ORF Transcript_10018/g.15673 Transcript_10018/m.15673 type:complete len:810 (+) Transcript_10018:182-2611(+)